MVADTTASLLTLSEADSTTIDAATTSQGLSQAAKDAIYASTIAGGILLIALLIWIIHRQRVRRRNLKRKRAQDELDATTSPRRRPPAFGDMEEVSDGFFRYGESRQPVPAGLAERFRRKDAYIKATLGEAYPMHTDIRQDEHHNNPLPQFPALTRVSDADVVSVQSHHSGILPADGKVSPLPDRDSFVSEMEIAPVHFKKPANLSLEPPRWSWTNSQAPATPRMYVPTLASSKFSTNRFRMAMNWVKTHGERATSSQAPPLSKVILPKPGVLKNQAYKPNLAPNKLVKKSSVRRSSRLSDIEKGREMAREF